MNDRVPRTGETTVRHLLVGALALSLAVSLVTGPAVGAPAAASAPSLDLPGATAAGSLQPSCKPLPPIEVQLLPLSGVGPGEIERFGLAVTPRFPARWVRVRWIRSSERLVWVDGDSLATRPGGALLEHDFEVALRLPVAGLETLHCQVEVMAEDGQLWRRGVGLAVGPEAVRARGRLVSDGEGGQLLEFEAAPASQRVETDR